MIRLSSIRRIASKKIQGWAARWATTSDAAATCILAQNTQRRPSHCLLDRGCYVLPRFGIHKETLLFVFGTNFKQRFLFNPARPTRIAGRPIRTRCLYLNPITEFVTNFQFETWIEFAKRTRSVDGWPAVAAGRLHHDRVLIRNREQAVLRLSDAA